MLRSTNNPNRLNGDGNVEVEVKEDEGHERLKEQVAKQEKVLRDRLKSKYDEIERESQQLGKVKKGLDDLERGQQKDIEILRDRIELVQRELAHRHKVLRKKEKQYVVAKQKFEQCNETKERLTEKREEEAREVTEAYVPARDGKPSPKGYKLQWNVDMYLVDEALLNYGEAHSKGFKLRRYETLAVLEHPNQIKDGRLFVYKLYRCN